MMIVVKTIVDPERNRKNVLRPFLIGDEKTETKKHLFCFDN